MPCRQHLSSYSGSLFQLEDRAGLSLILSLSRDGMPDLPEAAQLSGADQLPQEGPLRPPNYEALGLSS